MYANFFFPSCCESVEHLRSRCGGRPADAVQMAGQRGRLRGADERRGCRQW